MVARIPKLKRGKFNKLFNITYQYSEKSKMYGSTENAFAVRMKNKKTGNTEPGWIVKDTNLDPDLLQVVTKDDNYVRLNEILARGSKTLSETPYNSNDELNEELKDVGEKFLNTTIVSSPALDNLPYTSSYYFVSLNSISRMLMSVDRAFSGTSSYFQDMFVNLSPQEKAEFAERFGQFDWDGFWEDVENYDKDAGGLQDMGASRLMELFGLSMDDYDPPADFTFDDIPESVREW